MATVSALLHCAAGTTGKLCGAACGPLLANRPHNDSCFRASTNSFFAFDVQPHFHVGDSCFGENDPSAPFFFNGMYHVMWQSHTQYEHVPAWNKAPGPSSFWCTPTQTCPPALPHRPARAPLHGTKTRT